MTKSLLVALAALVVLLPAAQAHGPVNAREVETLIVDDELSDAFYTTGGYDLGELYLGEAWIEGLGDGLYLHTILFGGYNDPLDRPWSATFRFETQDGKALERTMATSDGATFESDFDVLETEVTDEEVEVLKAFIAYDGSDLQRGSVITALSARTFVDDEARDVAPGGIFVPGSQGQAEVPTDSSQVVDSYPLIGPTRYASARLEHTSAGVVVNVTSLLKEGDQHIHVEGTGVRLAEPDPFELKANGSRSIGVEVGGPGEVVVTTDIGGRTVISIADMDGSLAAVHEDGTTVPLAAGDVADKDAPGLPLALALAALALVLGAQRRW